MKAASLRIQARDRDEIRVDLVFRADLVAHLPRLLPVSIRRWLATQCIDPARLGWQALSRGLPPGELFLLTRRDETVRAWLE